MRIALLSDIHSNVFALDAVLKDIATQGVDITVNLGDILYGPIAPKATYERLMEHDFVTISGNQDRQIYEASNADNCSNTTMAFILEDLNSEAVQWLGSLPFDKQLSEAVYLCHATPKDDLTYLLEDVSQGHAQLRCNRAIHKLLGAQRSELICCGHTHLPRVVNLNNGQTIVNPGSVGLQAYNDDVPLSHAMQNNTPDARYSIVEKIGDNWHVENICVSYPTERAIKASKQRRRPDWCHYLATGNAL